MGVRRPGFGSLISFNIIRDVIKVNSIEASFMIKEGIGYIKLSSFTMETPSELRDALFELLEEGMEALILDLRGNPGGLLSASVEVADEFLPGRKLVTYMKGKHFPARKFYTSRDGLFENGPMAVLVDSRTASASEILAGALKAWERATLIGTRTFGKGLVQEEFKFSDGSALRLTVAYYFTPDGKIIQKPWRKKDTLSSSWGIEPDIVISTDSLWQDPLVVYFMASGKILEFIYSLPAEFYTRLKTLYPTIDVFASDFNVNKSMINRLLESAETHPDIFNDKRSIQRLGRVLKMFIARRIWGTDGFYYVRAKEDPVVQKAVKILEEELQEADYLHARS